MEMQNSVNDTLDLHQSLEHLEFFGEEVAVKDQMGGPYVLLRKLFRDFHLYFDKCINGLSSFPCRCLYRFLIIAEVRLLYVKMKPKEQFGKLSCFWRFIMAKYVSIRR